MERGDGFEPSMGFLHRVNSPDFSTTKANPALNFSYTIQDSNLKLFTQLYFFATISIALLTNIGGVLPVKLIVYGV